MRHSWALAIALLALALVPAARAEESLRPALDGHTFLPTDLVPDAFVHTYVRTSLGYAEATSIDYPPIVIAGDTLRVLTGNLSYATLAIEYRAKLREWLALQIGGGLVSRLGTATASLVHEGVTVQSGLEFEWIAKLRETQRTYLSGSLGVTRQTVTVVDVKQFAQDVADGIPNARLIDAVPVVRTRGGLRYAWAASPSWGFTVVGLSSYGDSPRRRDDDAWGYDLAGSVDYDLQAARGVPVGIALGYRLSSLAALNSTEEGNSSQTVLRIAYTGTHSVVAVDILGVFNRENSVATNIWAGGGAFSIRTYF